jgi:hypothetical protein
MIISEKRLNNLFINGKYPVITAELNIGLLEANTCKNQDNFDKAKDYIKSLNTVEIG